MQVPEYCSRLVVDCFAVAQDGYDPGVLCSVFEALFPT